MDINVHFTTNNQFTNYSSSSVTIDNKEYSHNIAVTNTEIVDFAISNIKEMTYHDLEQFIINKPDLIIFGTGDSIVYPDLKILEKLSQLGIGFEVMPVAALCRTFNFLISENRKLLGILFFQ